MEAGATVKLVGPEAMTHESKHGYPAKADLAAAKAKAKAYDAVVVPGGYAPDKLRRYPEVLDPVQDVFGNGGIVAAICHAAWVPISAGILGGKRATCVSAIRDDITNAGRSSGVRTRYHRGPRAVSTNWSASITL